MPISPIPEILDELSQGRMVILVDDPGRENEGDLACRLRSNARRS